MVDAFAHPAKSSKALHVSVSANPMSCWTPMETAILVATTKSSLMDSVFAKPGTLSTAVVSALWPVEATNSPIKGDVPFVLSTLFSRLRSTGVDVLQVITRTTLESVPRSS